jgi:hypothetical protein
MFDKITIRAKVTDAECAHLARVHRLQVWVNEDGSKVEYRSSQYSNITGVEVRIARNTATISVSLHKFWNERARGVLRNDDLFTVSAAKAAFGMLLFENGFLPEKTRVVRFEIGLNLPVTHDPITFIEKVLYMTGKDNNRLMFIDANYWINRQRTTAKYRTLRKYFKIYDKKWEMMEKRRGGDEAMKRREEGSHGPHVLRIESVYKRHSEPGQTFFSDKNVERLVNRFYVDWKDLFFEKKIRADKGARKSEVDRARFIVNFGKNDLMEKAENEYISGYITAKQYRTIREFVRDWGDNAHRFKVVTSPQEREFKRLLMQEFQKAKM